ncbi:hypothetical protein HC256_000756 [Beauveria bassiana]|nr:hypothetical protein HC256_000756 [Beauveria bassiana]
MPNGKRTSMASVMSAACMDDLTSNSLVACSTWVMPSSTDLSVRTGVSEAPFVRAMSMLKTPWDS